MQFANLPNDQQCVTLGVLGFGALQLGDPQHVPEFNEFVGTRLLLPKTLQ